MDRRIIYIFVIFVLLLAISGCGRKKLENKENITMVYGENRTEIIEENASILENQSKENIDFTKVYEENSDLNITKALLEKNEEVDSDLEDILGLID